MTMSNHNQVQSAARVLGILIFGTGFRLPQISHQKPWHLLQPDIHNHIINLLNKRMQQMRPEG